MVSAWTTNSTWTGSPIRSGLPTRTSSDFRKWTVTGRREATSSIRQIIWLACCRCTSSTARTSTATRWSPVSRAILSDFPILESRNTLLPRTGKNEQRGLLEALINVRGVPLRVFNTHLQHNSQAEREAQATVILDIIGARMSRWSCWVTSTPGPTPRRSPR